MTPPAHDGLRDLGRWRWVELPACSPPPPRPSRQPSPIVPGEPRTRESVPDAALGGASATVSLVTRHLIGYREIASNTRWPWCGPMRPPRPVPGRVGSGRFSSVHRTLSLVSFSRETLHSPPRGTRVTASESISNHRNSIRFDSTRLDSTRFRLRTQSLITTRDVPMSARRMHRRTRASDRE